MPIIYTYNFILLHFSGYFMYIIYENWIRRGIQRIRYFAFYYYMQFSIKFLIVSKCVGPPFKFQKVFFKIQLIQTSCKAEGMLLLVYSTFLHPFVGLYTSCKNSLYNICHSYQSFSFFLSYMFVVSLHVFFVTLFSALTLNILQFDSHLYTYIIIHVPCGRTHVSRITDITNNIHFSSLNILYYRLLKYYH